jgi:hypothetical protein
MLGLVSFGHSGAGSDVSPAKFLAATGSFDAAVDVTTGFEAERDITRSHELLLESSSTTF